MVLMMLAAFDNGNCKGGSSGRKRHCNDSLLATEMPTVEAPVEIDSGVGWKRVGNPWKF